MSERELNLDGAEVSVIKALGLSGTELTGENLIERCRELAGAELIDTLKSLMMLGYVVSDSGTFHTADDIKHVTFRVNSGYTRELREALNPQRVTTKSKRVRRE